ncbi:MAG: hypothetical protein VYE22_34155 [Myxococcota bacterium]|nr:hypothetical protein [Myxococcota bacterium]
MELHALLESADAPDALVAEVKEAELEFDAAWARVARADHRLWLAAVGGTPVEVLVEATAAAVLTAVDTFTEAPEPVVRALELSVGGAEPAELLAAAEACEAVAVSGFGAGGYRSAAEPGSAEAARAAALVARGAEGLAAGEAQREALRLDQARARSAYLGVGVQVALSSPEGPARLDVLAAAGDPAQGAFLFVVAACAEAVRESARAVAAGNPRADAAEASALEDLDRVVRRAIEES